ncbi:hypothetical protein H4219_003237 [Mycoemilia scoparia]|uniref:Alkaline ceramidase n=1 Tax=Mycoemilia scoparia TaxID=417184 RepID=A0A9W8DN38_9FUNG|nr:hypothetical protein H4219_003237 [Mycoemilia scoparia]
MGLIPQSATPEGYGYWGKITSSVDWCEENYEHSHYVAEFFNSYSSFAMIVLGEIAVRMNCTNYIAFTIMARTITLVGIGSFMFHATLKYHMQMLDEVPMLWAILCAFYIQTKYRYKITSQWFKLGCIGWGIFITLLTAGFEGNTQFYCFHVSFGSLVYSCMYYMYKSLQDLKARGRFEFVPIFYKGIALYTISVTCWLIDTNLCHLVNGKVGGSQTVLPINPQLHAWWHVIISFGLYYLVIMFMADYCVAHNIPFRLSHVLFGLLPTISAINSPHLKASLDKYSGEHQYLTSKSDRRHHIKDEGVFFKDSSHTD